MNNQTKQRYISTSIWSDDWFDSLSEREKLVYFYLLTNEHTNAAGVYQCTLKNVRLEIGLSRDEIEQIMAKFTADGKAFYYREYIIIPKWLKHQKIKERSKMFLGAIAVLRSLPDEIKRFIADRSHYDFDVQKYIQIQPEDSLSIAYPENDAENRYPIEKTDEKTDSLSIAYPENDEKSAHDLDSDSDLDLEFKNISFSSRAIPPRAPPDPTQSSLTEKPDRKKPLSPPHDLSPPNLDFDDEQIKQPDDAIRIWNLAREYWNERELKPECRDLMIRPIDRDEILRTFQLYSWEEIRNAIGNYAWHKYKAGPEYRPPPPYGSLAGFLKNGVAKYFDDDALDQQFREEKS